MNENELLCFADIRAEEVEWLWYPYIPYGKLTILQGDPGSGKTMLALSLAALLSNGQCLPFAQQAGESVNILYQMSEDGLADTIKPRLVSAQADCSRILSIDENTAVLTFGDSRLEETVRQKNIRLVILDPLSAYIGATVSLNQANEVRSAFRSLYTMAQRTGCAVLIVAHMNKMKGRDALYRTSGSIDIAGAVRSILTVAKYKNSPTLRVMVPVKSNLAPAGSALLFELTDHVEWREQIEADADLLLAGLDRKAVPTKQDRAAEELTRVLRKPTYMGYCVYNCSRTTDYLEHTRVTNHDNETYVRVKGNFPAIIDEELWLRCDAIRKSRNMHLLDENGKPKKYGCTVAKNVWVTKLVCSCGSRFRRFEWNTRADGTKVYGFACYRSSKRSLKYLQQHGLPEGVCEQTDFPQWKLELMAVKVFDMVWNTRREAVLEACRMLNECYRQESADPEALRQLDEDIEKLNGMVEKLITMWAADRITLEQFISQSSEVSLQLQRAKNERAALKSKAENSQKLDMDAIEASLCEAVRLEDGKVDEWFIETFVRQITPLPGNRFAWVLDLAPEQ